ncbi:MAG: C4-dicarboxylate-binding protein DctP [Sulfitobacter sp.]|jgi:TRAP-type transport system periplasmic protein
MNFKFGTAAILAAGLLATTAPSVSFAADFVMKISSPAPITEIDPLSAWFAAFEADVEAKSGGRIDVQMYPSSQLGPIPATVEGVAMGTIEMSTPAIGFLTGLDPRFQIFDAIGIFDDEHHALKTLSDPSVRAMMRELGKNANVEPLFILTSGQANVVTTKPVTQITDFQGLKMRTGGATALVNKPLETLGVSPVAMPLGDVLPGIQTGTIDGTLLNMPVSVGFKFADVAKESVYMPGKFAIIGGIVSRDFLAMVGPDLEEIIRNGAVNANEAFAAKLDSGAATLNGVWQKQGGNLNVFSDSETEALLQRTVKVVEEVVAQDAQMQADYDTLKAAAQAAR